MQGKKYSRHNLQPLHGMADPFFLPTIRPFQPSDKRERNGDTSIHVWPLLWRSTDEADKSRSNNRFDRVTFKTTTTNSGDARPRQSTSMCFCKKGCSTTTNKKRASDNQRDVKTGGAVVRISLCQRLDVTSTQEKYQKYVKKEYIEWMVPTRTGGGNNGHSQWSSLVTESDKIGVGRKAKARTIAHSAWLALQSENGFQSIDSPFVPYQIWNLPSDLV